MKVCNSSSEDICRDGSKSWIYIMVNLTQMLIFRKSDIIVEQMFASPEQWNIFLNVYFLFPFIWIVEKLKLLQCTSIFGEMYKILP